MKRDARVRAAGEGQAGVPGRLIAIHPAVLFSIIWAISGLVWVFAPQSVIDLTVDGKRATSLHALLYFGGCIVLFLAGCIVAGALPGRTSPAPTTQQTDRRDSVKLAAVLLASAALAGALLWFFRIAVRVGGPAGLLDLFSAGETVNSLKTEVADPAQLPPLTTLVHLTPVAVALLFYVRRRWGWTGVERWLFWGLIAATSVRAVLLAERIAALGVIVALVVTYVICAERLDIRRMARYAVAALLVGWLVWTGGEFLRSWRDKQPVGASRSVTLSNYVKSLSYSHTRLGGYMFTAINNGVIIVRDWPTQTFPEAVAPPLASAGFPSFGTQPPDLYKSELSPEFTGETMFGAFFRDVRDGGILLALAYGAFFGLAWRAAARGSVVGIVLYAATAEMVVDSARMTYLFDTVGLGALLGTAAVWLLLHGPRHAAHPARAFRIPAAGRAAIFSRRAS